MTRMQPTVPLALIGLAILSATPAHADIASTITSLTTTYLTGALFHAIAVIMIIMIGIGWMFGQIEMRKAAMLVVGIGVVTSAQAIATALVGT